MENSKLHIEILILVFMMTTLSLSILFSLYYISPSNYVLYDFKESEKPTLTKEFVIQPNKHKKIKACNYPNKVLRVYSTNSEYIPVTLENRFKSENIYVTKDNLIKLANSDLIIKNKESDVVNVKMEVYSFM